MNLYRKIYFKILNLLLGNTRGQKIKSDWYIKRHAKTIQKEGPAALRIFYDLTKEIRCSYWLHWGTLLGAFREKGFIKHDEDIDIGMFDTDISIALVDKMLQSGFVFLEAIVDKDFEGGYHLAFDYNGAKFDIYSFHKDIANRYCTCFTPVPYQHGKWGKVRSDIFDILHVSVPLWDGLVEIPFEGTTAYIPSNTDEILQIYYGKDYMIPMKKVKSEDADLANSYKVHEDSEKHYACKMNFEVFKMLRLKGLI